MPRSLPRLRLSRLRLRKAFPIRELERVLEDGREVAAVIGLLGRRGVGDLLRLELVAPAQLQPVDPHLAGGVVDQPLHEVVALGPAGAAVGGHEARVGEHALGRDLDQRRAVDADHVLDRIERRRQRRHRAEIGAHVAGAGEPQREEAAVGVERELGDLLVVAAVAVGEEARRALVGPFDRPPEQARAVQHRDVFGIGLRLHAEGAADIAGEQAQLGRRNVEDFGELAAQAEHALASDMEGEALALRIVGGDRGARLHGVDDEAVVEELEPRHMGGVGEGLLHLLGVAEMIVERDVVGHVVEELRRAGLHRLARLGDRGEGLDVEHDRFRGLLRLDRGLGDHAGDGVADEADLVDRERRAERLLHRRAVAVLERRHAFEPAIAGGLQVGAGIDREHAGHRARGRSVDALEHAMGMARPHDRRIGLAGKAQVVGVAALAAHELGVLGARHRLPDAELLHRPCACIILNIHDFCAPK